MTTFILVFTSKKILLNYQTFSNLSFTKNTTVINPQVFNKELLTFYALTLDFWMDKLKSNAKAKVIVFTLFPT